MPELLLHAGLSSPPNPIKLKLISLLIILGKVGKGLDAIMFFLFIEGLYNFWDIIKNGNCRPFAEKVRVPCPA
jgi:hypothetical protein